MTLLVGSCAKPALDEAQVLFVGQVELTRGQARDTAELAFETKSPGTVVVIVEEGDADVHVRISATGVAQRGQSIEVGAPNASAGIEVAALDIATATRFHLTFDGAPGTPNPAPIQARVLYYPAPPAHSQKSERLAAYHKWTAATRATNKLSETRRQSIQLMGEVIAHFVSASGEPRMAAWSRMVKAGLCYSAEVGWKSALEEARHAERAFAELPRPDLRQAARARYLQAESLLQLATNSGAVQPTPAEAASEAKRIFLELRSPSSPLSPLWRARATNNLGYLGFAIDDMRMAHEYWEMALREMRQVDHIQGRLQVLQNLGTLASEEGSYRQAVRYFDEVMAEIDRVWPIYLRITAIYNAAMADEQSGNAERAIERLVAGQQLARELGSRVHEARILHGLGRVYWRRGDWTQADSYVSEALAIRRSLDDNVAIMSSLRLAGALARERGDIDRALSMHAEADSRSLTALVRVRAKVDLALDHLAAGDVKRATRFCREALALADGGSDFYKLDEARLILAELLLQGGSASGMDQAQALTDAALSAALRRSDPMLEIWARRVRGYLRLKRGRFAEARREYENAINLTYDYRRASSNPELQASTLANEHALFREYVELLMRDLVTRAPARFVAANEDEVHALRTLEFARTLNFLPSQGMARDPATQARMDGLLSQMAEKRVRIAAIADRSSPPGRDLELLQLDMARLRTELDRLRTMSTADPVATATGPLHDLTWDPLEPGVVQLSYALGTRHAYLWRRDARGVSVGILPASPRRIRTHVATLNRIGGERTSNGLDLTLGALSKMLLPAGSLDESVTRIEVVAEGELAGIPFAALGTPIDRSRKLADSSSVRMIASMLATRGRNVSSSRQWAFVGVAGGTRHMRGQSRVFPKLATTREETNRIAALYVERGETGRVRLLHDEAGTAEELRRLWASGSQVMHFATHGLANPRHPIASLLLLPASRPDGAASYLTAGQVEDWIGNVDLVFLSACETAAGPARFADGMPGLERAFLRAGARGVIATLWPIEDVTAHEFSTDFYSRLITGVPPEVALRDTQRDWSQAKPGHTPDEAARRRVTAWAHVFFTH